MPRCRRCPVSIFCARFGNTISLIRDVDSSTVKQKLVKSLASLCKDMGLYVVAEGIETRGERDAVIDLGCDLLQGYQFARPGPAFPEARW
jgi:EAL domain-containing protein (putative c-di-GMP-specific phosphodiesterase class I)